MGYRVSWIARRGSETQGIIDVSRRQLTGERHDFPDVGWYLLELPNAVDTSWVLLIADGSENFGDLDPKHAKALSKGGNETLYFACSDTVMGSGLACFRNGSEIWTIDYYCEDENQRPAMTGDVPQVAHDILKALRAKQEADDDVDYIYELTADVGRALVGFRHDIAPETDDPEPFQVLDKKKRKTRKGQV